jgi:hypothetical protein
VSSFDSVSQDWLVRFVEHRVGDKRIVRLIRKWLKAGIPEDGTVTVSDRGTGQGSVISPLLGYLHYVLDLWAKRWRRNEATGDMIIVRYADDVVVGFEREADANRFLEAIAHAVRGVCSVAPSGQDSPDRVRPPCRGQTQTRNLYLVLASPSSAVNHAAANSYSKGRAGAAACRPSWRRSRRNCDTAGTSQSPNRECRLFSHFKSPSAARAASPKAAHEQPQDCL